MRKVGRPKKEDQVDLLDQLQKIHKKFGGITPARVVSEAKRNVIRCTSISIGKILRQLENGVCIKLTA